MADKEIFEVNYETLKPCFTCGKVVEVKHCERFREPCGTGTHRTFYCAEHSDYDFAVGRRERRDWSEYDDRLEEEEEKLSKKRPADSPPPSEDEPEPVKQRTVGLRLVISGGQDGADIAGVRAAKKVGLKTGGWMPIKFTTVSGPKPEYEDLYEMRELHHKFSDENLTRQYRVRTVYNARDSDGTILFDRKNGSPGSALTTLAAREYDKPVLEFAEFEDECAVKRAVDWITENDIKILNVAGNRDADSDAICAFLVQVFEQVLGTPKIKNANKT